MQDNNLNQYIIGRNAVMEALRAGRPIDCILVARGDRMGSVGAVIAKAREMGITIKEVSPAKLDGICPQGNHQGIAASAAAAEYADLEDLFRNAEKKGEPPFFIIADEIEDPHNLGAIIRTADAAGAHGVIIPKRRATGLTLAVGKASAGAVEYVPVAKVPNLARCIDELKKRGVWVYGTDMDGETWCSCDMSGAIAIVVGSEGEGMNRLIKDKCDFIVSLPMKGSINSLNASVAAGIVMYEAARQRNLIPAKQPKGM